MKLTRPEFHHVKIKDKSVYQLMQEWIKAFPNTTPQQRREQAYKFWVDKGKVSLFSIN